MRRLCSNIHCSFAPCVLKAVVSLPLPGSGLAESAQRVPQVRPQEHQEASQEEGRQLQGQGEGHSGRPVTGSAGVRGAVPVGVARQAVPQTTLGRCQGDDGGERRGENSAVRDGERALPVAVSLHGTLAPQACREV